MKPNCRDCPFADPKTKKPRHEMVEPSIPKLPPVGVLIGEGPGAEEVSQGQPFVGSTGHQLDQSLEDVKLDRKRLVVMNAMACRPPQGMKTDENLRDATACCRPWALATYEKYKKLPTLAMGKWASTVPNQGKPITIMKGRGFVRENLLATWHPTYAFFHNPWCAGEFLNDLARFKRMIDGKLEPMPTVITEPTMKDLATFTRSAKEFAVLLRKLAGDTLPPFTHAASSDIETRAEPGQPDYEGKDPTRAGLRCLALGTPDLSVAHWWGNGHPGVESWFIDKLTDPNWLIIGHNWWFFDDRVTKRKGVRTKNIIDTRDMRRAVSATSRLSLRHLVSIYSDFAPWKETEDEK